MPVLNVYRPPIDSRSLSNRRVWPFPELQSHSLLVLTLDELYLAPPCGEPHEQLVAEAEADGDLDDLFGPLATVVELPSVTRARLDLLANSLTLDLAHGQPADRVKLVFATPEAADACFSRLWSRLGDGCKLLSQRQDWRSLVKLPLFCLAVVLALTAILATVALAANEMPAQGAATSLNVPGELVLSGPLRGIDWRWICATGGAAAAATQVWLWRRVTYPPVSLEVVRS